MNESNENHQLFSTIKHIRTLIGTAQEELVTNTCLPEAHQNTKWLLNVAQDQMRELEGLVSIALVVSEVEPVGFEMLI